MLSAGPEYVDRSLPSPGKLPPESGTISTRHASPKALARSTSTEKLPDETLIGPASLAGLTSGE